MGFEVGMFAGSIASATVLGAPDYIVLTLSEFAQQIHRICRASEISLMVDADHGYGNALNVKRTVEELETAGVAALTIEDTLLPKAYGSSGTSLISIDSEQWKGKLAIRSSNNLYNQSLVASLIARYGEAYTENWARGLVKNFARKPQGNDRAQIIAVANNEADLAIANSYYLGLMLSGKKGEKQLSAGKKVKILFPSQNKNGAHINISGAGILKSSKNYNNAVKFLEFMLSEEAQKHLVENTYEYPVNLKVKPSVLMSQFGISFKEDDIEVSNFGKYNSDALKLMDRVG